MPECFACQLPNVPQDFHHYGDTMYEGVVATIIGVINITMICD